MNIITSKIAANRDNIKQAQGTPFIPPPLSDEVGRLSVGTSICMILDGTYKPLAELDEYTRKLIVQFQQKRKAKRESPELQIRPEEWKTFWKGAKECTFCASDILHFGTWKTGAHSDIIAELDALLMNIPMQYGYLPSRWRTAVDALLLKKSGVMLIEKLRTIFLFQGDFNYMNKFIGSQMMKNSEFYDQLAWEPYGS
jgi:hypothetical protein